MVISDHSASALSLAAALLSSGFSPFRAAMWLYFLNALGTWVSGEGGLLASMSSLRVKNLKRVGCQVSLTLTMRRCFSQAWYEWTAGAGREGSANMSLAS